MEITSVIPEDHNGPTSTTIWAKKDDKSLPLPYTYSHAYELIHDPNAPYTWMQWNGGTLTEAIQFVISL